MKGLTVLAIAGLALTGCTTEGLAFQQDKRVEVVSPDYREVVDLPVTLDWEITDPGLEEQVGNEVEFGLLMDIDPQPPGESLDYFGRDDPFCQKQETCPNERYLRRLGVYATSATEMTFDSLPIAPGVDLEAGQSDVHFATLILLNSDGTRLGESAWQIVFEVERGGS